MALLPEEPRVSAVLGPTNTGKTYLAIERMLDFETGMIGFPLRLLARENYDKVVRLKGARDVALITGEEKIIPAQARYFICTVESMPLEREVDFLAIDEIQLAADEERGHVFTDRLLRARGVEETMFLGADTMRPLIASLVKDVKFVSRPRFSSLTHSGYKKLNQIPPRSAVVAFSAADVYAIAEHVRHQRGGAAVVLGALSPRTRNAQVAIYQSGEVDYLVATDAIGMGLNMDVDHVAFAGLRKFDGRRQRALAPHELAQIAGRAGRHMNDGTFGTTSDKATLEPDVVEAVENHRFGRLQAVWWRNAELDFASTGSLVGSLEATPPVPQLMRAQGAEDQASLAQLIKDEQIAAIATSPGPVRLLWNVCQIPDYRKTMVEAHTRLLARIYLYLTGTDERLPVDWVAGQLAHLDRVDGDIDTLMARIAHTRTWTFITHRADWLDDAGGWQSRARAIEDRLSDALHQRLTQRFVDRNAAMLKRMRGNKSLIASVDRDGGVTVDGSPIGRLQGFRFVADKDTLGTNARAVESAARRALRSEIAGRVDAMEDAADQEFALMDDGRIGWDGVSVGRFSPGADVLSPRVEVLGGDMLSADLRARAEARLGQWFDAQRAEALGPLMILREAELAGAARGLAFQLVGALGSLVRKSALQQIRALTPEDKKALRMLGVRLGLESVFMPQLLKPRAAVLRARLWTVHCRSAVIAPPQPGLVTVEVADAVPAEFYEAVGYRVVAGRAIRVDIHDRFAVRLMLLARKGVFAPDAELMSLLGLGPEQIVPVIEGLGYEKAPGGEGYVKSARVRRAPKSPSRSKSAKAGKDGGAKLAAKSSAPPHRKKPKVDPDSPFAKLAEMRLNG